MRLSEDQAAARDRALALLKRAGVDVSNAELLAETEGDRQTFAILGRAGSGKTALLAELVEGVVEAGVELVSGDYESKAAKSRRTVAILAPTNKAASVLRRHGLPATTIHRILYTPVYAPEYEAVAAWLSGDGERPDLEDVTPAALDRALAFYRLNRSIPAALASIGLRGSDFIQGWKRRDDPLDIGFVDEASMLDERQLADLREIFSTLFLFGDPAQLAPVGGTGRMALEDLPETSVTTLRRIHRQEAGNPILDLAHALAEPDLSFEDFEDEIRAAARKDPRVVVCERVDADAMARAPVLVWRNATRIRLIHAFRQAHGAPEMQLLPGEPLICDGVELPARHRKRRMDLEARGLVKGAQAIFLGEGRKPGFSRVHVLGAEDPNVSVATIIQIEAPDQEEPFIPSAAKMGAVFLHGAAVTIHKAQGSQWPDVQVFAPDLYGAARSGRMESGTPIWKRLAYVAITRAEERLLWVTRYRLGRPEKPLETEDLSVANPDLALSAPT